MQQPVAEGVAAARDNVEADRSDQRTTHGAPRVDLVAVFTFMWAAFVLFHLGSNYSLSAHLAALLQGTSSGFATGASLWKLLLAIGAFVCLIRPRIGTLVLLCSLQLADVVIRSPFTSNHWLFAGLQAAMLLSCVVYGYTKRADAGQVWEWFSDAGRRSVYALYVFVVLHKLNAGYWDIDTSCASYFWEHQHAAMPFLPDGDWWRRLLMVASVGVEAGIPVLLAFSRTRLMGVLVLVGFHGAIGFHPLSGFYNFSSMLFAMTVCFAGQRVITGGIDALLRMGVAPSTFILGVRVLLIGLFVPLLLVADAALQRAWLVTAWTVYVVIVGACVVAAIRQRAVVARAPRSVRPRWLLVGPVCVVVLGLGPYVGYRFEGTFAMFSNLRVEGGEWNHLIIPPAVRQFGYMEELVHVSDASVDAIRMSPGRWTPFELRRHLSRVDAPWIDIVEAGVVRRIDVRTERPDLVQPLSYWQEKVMWFRTVSPSSLQPCVH